MIKANNAIRTARLLIGTPYSEMDCIAFIRSVIKRTAGGDAAYRCEGTNWLWRSIDNASKYRHLVWRQESIDGARAGMLAFKRDGDDIHHVGLVTSAGTVIHSSSVKGMVVETPLDDTWHLLGQHKLIAVADKIEPETEEQNVAVVEETVQAAPTKSRTSLVNNVDGYVMILDGDWRIADD